MNYYVGGKASSDKANILNVFDKQLKTKDKKCCPVDRLATDSRSINHIGKIDWQHKKKQLKSRRERSHMRPYANPRHCHHQTSKDVAHVLNCHHSKCNFCPSRDAPFSNVVNFAKEPSIITDSRLTGHQGLFNHEVKSIDIERMLSERRKLERSAQQVQGKSNVTSHPSSTVNIYSPLSTNELLSSNCEEAQPLEKTADDATKASNESGGQENISHGSDVTPGQRTHPLISSGSYKSIFSSKHSSINVGEINPVMSDKDGQFQQTPIAERETVKAVSRKAEVHNMFTVEPTHSDQESPAPQTKAPTPSPNPKQLPRSHTLGSSDPQNVRQEPDHISQSVSALAAGLSDSLHFPFLKRRSLVADSREVLLKALRERHGPQFQENLLKVQKSLSFGTDSSKEILDQEPTTMVEDELLSTDVFTTEDGGIHPRSGNHKNTSFKMGSGRCLTWKFGPHLHPNLKQTAEWSSVKTSTGLLDDILRPNPSPQFCIDFEPLGITSTDPFFFPSSTSCWAGKPSVSLYLENGCNVPTSKEAVTFGSFGNRFSLTSAVTKGSSVSRYNDQVQPLIQSQLLPMDRQSVGQMYFPQEQDSFGTDRYSLSPSSLSPSSARLHHSWKHNLCEPIGQFGPPSTCPSLTPPHTNMMHYPPSHMLERDPALPLSLPNPEYWSFPPMRLY